MLVCDLMSFEPGEKRNIYKINLLIHESNVKWVGFIFLGCHDASSPRAKTKENPNIYILKISIKVYDISLLFRFSFQSLRKSTDLAIE
jgi:hypothetical protein